MENKRERRRGILISISLVIPTYNRPDMIVETLKHYLKDFPENGELIVVDQSAERNSEIIKLSQAHYFLKYFRISEKGLPNARNVGCLKASGHIIIYTDDDVIPSSTLIAAYEKIFDNPSVGGAAGRVRLSTDIHTTKRQRRPRIRTLDGMIFSDFNQETQMEVDHAQGCNMAFRRSLILKAGGFDKRFGGNAHLEETDLCMRIRKLGYKIIYLPKASLIHVVHIFGGCRTVDLSDWLYWYSHNYILFFMKNFNRKWLPVFFAERLVKLILTAIRERRLSCLTRGLSGLRQGMKTIETENSKVL